MYHKFVRKLYAHSKPHTTPHYTALHHNTHHTTSHTMDTGTTYIHLFTVYIVWRIGTDIGTEDVFPATEVSFSGAESASINGRTLYLNNMRFAGLDEIFSLAEGADEASVNDQMAIEPGRLYYHTVQFCSFAHKCVDVITKPSIVISKL